jgi:hypothetical protein
MTGSMTKPAWVELTSGRAVGPALDPSVGIRGPGGVFNCGPTPAAAAAAAEPIVGVRAPAAPAAAARDPPRPGSSAAAMAKIPFPPPLPPSAVVWGRKLKLKATFEAVHRVSI